MRASLNSFVSNQKTIEAPINRVEMWFSVTVLTAPIRIRIKDAGESLSAYSDSVNLAGADRRLALLDCLRGASSPESCVSRYGARF